jgi:hypothetical protein
MTLADGCRRWLRFLRYEPVSRQVVSLFNQLRELRPGFLERPCRVCFGTAFNLVAETEEQRAKERSNPIVRVCLESGSG